MKASKVQANIIFSQQIIIELEKIILEFKQQKIFLLTETTPRKLCLPIIYPLLEKYGVKVICIDGGEKNKSIANCEKVWEVLSHQGASRKSLLINLGGGMLTDLGGFVASLFKRGMYFVNIPTTLLAQVDAALGGKTGVNFGGLKNEIGVFSKPKNVLINSNFLRTLDYTNFLSGFAEMLKHGLIASENHWKALQAYNTKDIDYTQLEHLIAESNTIKDWHVQNDFREAGVRKALNFGHTAGHAFESFALHHNRPILHGFAVAYGMIVELYLSLKVCGFPKDNLYEISRWLIGKFGHLSIDESNYDELIELMSHDKKNDLGVINFTLLKQVGKAEVNCTCAKEDIIEALSFYQKINS